MSASAAAPGAKLVNAQPDEPEARTCCVAKPGRSTLYRAWSRRREDVDALRELHAAIGAYLQGTRGP